MHAPLRRIQDLPSAKKTHVVSFRLDDTDWESIARAVKESGATSAHEFARWVVVSRLQANGSAITLGGSDAL
jgi:hypothetical protein